MSETVHYRGVATKVIIPEGKTLVQVAEDILKERDPQYKIPPYTDGPLEALCDEYYNEYFFYPGNQSLYNITKGSIDLDEDIMEAKELEDGTIVYELKYYNGGAGFEECLEEAMDKMNKLL